MQAVVAAAWCKTYAGGRGPNVAGLVRSGQALHIGAPRNYRGPIHVIDRQPCAAQSVQDSAPVAAPR